MEANPYAPPQVTELSAPVSGMEAVRREHLRVERTAKSAGMLYYLVGFILLLVGGGGLLSVMASTQAGNSVDAAVGAAVFLVFGVVIAIAAYGLRRLRGWARWIAVVVSAFGLLGFPIGTIISAVILVNLLGPKANLVFSPAYQDIIAATPHVKMKTSMAMKVVLVILLLILASIVAWVSLME